MENELIPVVAPLFFIGFVESNEVEWEALSVKGEHLT